MVLPLPASENLHKGGPTRVVAIQPVPVHSLDRQQSMSFELRHLCCNVWPSHHLLRQRNAQDGFEKGPEDVSIT